MKNKKSVIYVIVVVMFSILSVFQLAACGKKDNAGARIILTKDNIEQYVDLSCHGYGDPNSYRNGEYSRLLASASTEGIRGYEYDNVFITVRIKFDDGSNYADPEIDLSLRTDGSAKKQVSYLICSKRTELGTRVPGSSISRNTYYEIVFVSGYVKRT